MTARNNSHNAQTKQPCAKTCKHTNANKILIFSTGGTIAMQPNPSGGVEPSHSSNQSKRWQENFANLPKNIELEEVAWANLPSPHLTLAHMLELSNAIDLALADKKVLGAVVLHGTDLLPETAFVLELTLKTTKPVVITGSMRHINEMGYDGLRNLNNALRICLEIPLASEIVATMGDEIYAARDIFKQNSIAANSMSSETGLLGRAMEQEIIFYQHPATAFYHPFEAAKILEHSLPKVALLTAYPGINGELVDLLLQKGVKGLVVEAFGAGNVPPSMSQSLKAVLAQKIPLIICSRCPQGGAHAIYSYEGGGRNLQEHGAILSANLSATKAQLFLQIALGCNYTPCQIQEFFNNK